MVMDSWYIEVPRPQDRQSTRSRLYSTYYNIFNFRAFSFFCPDHSQTTCGFYFVPRFPQLSFSSSSGQKTSACCKQIYLTDIRVVGVPSTGGGRSPFHRVNPTQTM